MTQPSFLPITRAVMRGKYHFLSERARSVSRPDEIAHGEAQGRAEHRVLVVGNEYAISWGVRLHALGLPGQLAQEISQRTGVGADVDVISDPGLSISDLLGRLEGRTLDAYDSVVAITGIGDAYTLLPPVRWIVQMKRLLEMLRLSTRESAQISVVGIQPGSSVNILKAKADGTVDRWAQTLNELTEGFCLRQERVHYLAPPDAESGDLDDVDRMRFKSPAVYKAWAVDVARHVVPLLALREATTQGVADAPAAVQDGTHRLAALEAVGLGGSAADARFLPVVRRARALFQAEGAAFNVIGEDTLIAKAVLGFDRMVIPAEQSFCAMTIKSSGPFVVEDSWNDSRAVPDTPIRFYAGYPVAAPDGTRIGALCIFGMKPRSDSTIDASFLRELAEDISQRLETPEPEMTAPVA